MFSSARSAPFERKSRPEERTVPVVIACVHTFQNRCTTHGNDCKLCITGVASTVSTYILDFKVVHCEFYFPTSNVTYGVNGSDMKVLRLPGRSYETEEGKDYYLFWRFMVSPSEYAAMIAYLDQRLDVEYDLATFFGYFGLASISCFLAPHTMSFDRYTADNIALYNHGLAKETCARLVLGTLISAGVVPNRDVRLVNCLDVYNAVKPLGIETLKLIQTNTVTTDYVTDMRFVAVQIDERDYHPSDEIVRQMQNPFAAPEHQVETLVMRDAYNRPIIPYVQRTVVRVGTSI